MCPAKHSCVQFGIYEVDLDEGTLRKAGVRIKVQHQPFKVLQALLDHPGELVTREQLHDRVWPDTSYGDFDQAVNVAVAKLRTALGDSADNPRFIETVPRRGYRFIAPVFLDRGVEIAPIEPTTAPNNGGSHVSSPVEHQHTGRRAIVWAAIAVAGTILVAIAYHFYPSRAAYDFHRVTYGKGAVRSARFGPDGHGVLYGASWNGKPPQVFWAPVESPEAHPYSLPDADILSVSPQGELAVLLKRRAGVGWISYGTLATMAIAGSIPREITEGVQDADWDPKGKNLAIVHWSGKTCNLQYPIGNVIYTVTGGRWLSDVRVSPRGDALAFLEHPLEGDDAGYVQLVDLKGQKKVLTHFWFSVRGLAWDASGDSVFFSASEVVGDRERPRAIYSIGLSGTLRRIVSESGDLTFHDLSRNGELLISRDVERYEILANVGGTVRDLSWLDFSRADDLSPDGQNIVLTVEGEVANRNYEVYVRKIDGSPPVKVGPGYGSAISPDGQWVLAIAPFGSGADAVPQMVLWPVGTGSEKVLPEGSIAHYSGGWFPDGNHVFFAGNRPGHPMQTWIQNLNGDPPRPITPEGVRGVSVSPDGKFLSAVDESGIVWLYPVDGGPVEKVKNIQPGETPIRWSQDGRDFYVANSDYLPVKVYRLDRFTGKRELVGELAPADAAGVIPDISSVFASADGRTLVFSYFRLQSDLYTATSK